MNTFLLQLGLFFHLHPAAAWFATAALQSSALLVAGFSAAAFLRNQSARARGWIWRCAFLGLLALAVSQGVSQMTGWQHQLTYSGKVTIRVPEGAGDPRIAALHEAKLRELASSSPLMSGPMEAPQAGLTRSVDLLPSLLLSISFFLIVWTVVRSIVGTRRIRRDTRHTGSVASKIPVEFSSSVETPVIVGLFRPVIVLPLAALEWSEERLQIVIRHETAHWAHGDLHWLFLAKVSACLWWWNPLVWRALGRLRNEVEGAADDAVLLARTDPAQYAETLVTIASQPWNPVSDAGLPMIGRSNLEARIQSILSPRRQRGHLGKIGRSFLGGMLVVVLLVCSAQFSLVFSSNVDTQRHYQANPEKNVLAQGNIRALKRRMEGWSGMTETVSFPGGDYFRIKAAGTNPAAVETALNRDPEWKCLTVLARTKPGAVPDPGQAMTINVSQWNGAQQVGQTAALDEQRRDGYTNWTCHSATIKLDPAADKIVTKITVAPGKGQLDVSELFLIPSDPADELDPDLVHRFYDKLKENDLNAVREMVKAEPKLVNARTGRCDNGTPLTFCAWENRPELAKLLIEQGADLEALDFGAWKATPLAWCGWWGSAQTAAVLLEAGANKKFRSVYGVTPVSSAKAGKQANGFSKNSPANYDETIRMLE